MLKTQRGAVGPQEARNRSEIPTNNTREEQDFLLEGVAACVLSVVPLAPRSGVQAGVRDQSLQPAPLCSQGLLQGMPGRGKPSQPSSPPCKPKSAVWGYIPNVQRE